MLQAMGLQRVIYDLATQQQHYGDQKKKKYSVAQLREQAQQSFYEMLARMEVTHGPKHGLQLSKSDLIITAVEDPAYQQKISALNSQYESNS